MASACLVCDHHNFLRSVSLNKFRIWFTRQPRHFATYSISQSNCTSHFGRFMCAIAIAWRPSTRTRKGSSACVCCSRSCCKRTNRNYGHISGSSKYSRMSAESLACPPFTQSRPQCYACPECARFISVYGLSSNGLSGRTAVICSQRSCSPFGIWFGHFLNNKLCSCNMNHAMKQKIYGYFR